jgi:hypothetical protein
MIAGVDVNVDVVVVQSVDLRRGRKERERRECANGMEGGSVHKNAPREGGRNGCPLLRGEKIGAESALASHYSR